MGKTIFEFICIVAGSSCVGFDNLAGAVFFGLLFVGAQIERL